MLVDRVVRFSDGDTFVIPYEGDEVRVRIKGVDCPEMRGKCKWERRLAGKAKRFTRGFVLGADRVELDVLELDYWGRLLCHVWCDGESLADALLGVGLARVYRGRKTDWCGSGK